jgi:hypothetical protein
LKVLSRKLPYFEYSLEAQIFAALSRGQLPKRPSDADGSTNNEEDWDDFDEPDWDEIDDPSWSLITRCCTPKPEDRLNASRIKELIVDLKMWDARPEVRDVPGAHLFKVRSNSDVNLNRVGELLNELQVRWLCQMPNLSLPSQTQILAQRTLQYSTGDVIAAVAKLGLDGDDGIALVNLWDLVCFSFHVVIVIIILTLVLRFSRVICSILMKASVPWLYFLHLYTLPGCFPGTTSFQIPCSIIEQ